MLQCKFWVVCYAFAREIWVVARMLPICYFGILFSFYGVAMWLLGS